MDPTLTCYLGYLPSKWLHNSLVTGSRTFHNNDEGHKICLVITLIVVEDSKAWSGWHGDDPITRNTSTANALFSQNQLLYFQSTDKGYCSGIPVVINHRSWCLFRICGSTQSTFSLDHICSSTQSTFSLDHICWSTQSTFSLDRSL